jgi:putative hydrolase of the HAD superfamily
MPKIKAICWDAGGTLFRPYPSVGEVYSRVALKHGVALEAVHIERRFHEAWHARNGLASLASLSSDKIERDWWHALVKDVFEPLTPTSPRLPASRRTSGDLSPLRGEGERVRGSFENFDAFFTELYDFFATAECWRLFDDALPVLDTLQAAGYPMVIVSNWDHRLFSIVKQLGLENYFREILASAAVGIAKPGRGIFEKAIAALNVEPGEALHIGDSLEEDYYGAQRAGLQAILLDRPHKAYNGVSHIRSLQDLIPLLTK